MKIDSTARDRAFGMQTASDAALVTTLETNV